MLAFWMGGASSSGVAPTTNGGVRSLAAFWMGGGASGAGAVIATPGRRWIDWHWLPDSRERQRLEQHGLDAEAEQALESVLARQFKSQQAEEQALRRALRAVRAEYRDIYLQLLAFERERSRLEEEGVIVMMIAALSQ